MRCSNNYSIRTETTEGRRTSYDFQSVTWAITSLNTSDWTTNQRPTINERLNESIDEGHAQKNKSIAAHVPVPWRNLGVLQNLLSCVFSRCVFLLRILYDSKIFDKFFHRDFLRISLLTIFQRGQHRGWCVIRIEQVSSWRNLIQRQHRQSDKLLNWWEEAN